MIKMYTSSKRGYVNAFASRLLRVVSETLLRDQVCKDQGLSNRSINNTRPLEVAPEFVICGLQPGKVKDQPPTFGLHLSPLLCRSSLPDTNCCKQSLCLLIPL